MTASYEIGSIPSQYVWQGQTIEFNVNPQESNRYEIILSVEAAPEPKGKIHFEFEPRDQEPEPSARPRSQPDRLFRFTAGPESREPFELIFSATDSGGGRLINEQTVTITPVPRVVSDLNLVSQPLVKPDPESRNYLRWSEVRSLDEELFNTSRQKPATVDISGMRVVFDEGDLREDSLHRLFNGRTDIKELRIYADEVIIKSPLNLPQTNVTIYARNLSFRGQNARLLTVPVFNTLAPDQAKDGDKGANGGNVTIYAEEFSSSPADKRRFDVRGAKGQTGGPGKPGPDAVPMPRFPFDSERPDYFRRWDLPTYEGDPKPEELKKAVYVEYWITKWNWDGTHTPVRSLAAENKRFQKGPKGTTYRTNWPTHWGEKKRANHGLKGNDAGKPGDGGDAGILKTNCYGLLRAEPVIRGQGHPGNQQQATLGGNALDPSEVIWAKLYLGRGFGSRGRIWTAIIKRDVSKKGASTPSPTAQPGKRTEVFNRNSDDIRGAHWLHPYCLQVVLQYAKDLYLAKRNDEAQELIERYGNYLDCERYEVPDEHSLPFDTLRGEMQTLLHRLSGNLDYFGNPAGWVPMLSFEANHALYRKEIENAIPILFLAYWIGEKGKSLSNKQTFLGHSIRILEDENKNAEQAFNEAQGDLPKLQLEINAVSTALEACEAQLKLHHENLLDLATTTVEAQRQLRSSLKIIGAIMQLIPVGQPALGAVGAGLIIVSDLDTEKPYETSGKLGAELAKFGKENLEGRAKRITAELKKDEDSAEKKEAKHKAAELIKYGKNFAPALKATNDALKDLNAPQSEIDAELNRLKGENEGYVEIIERIQNELNPQKVTLFANMQQLLNTLTDSYNSMISNLQAIDLMNIERSAVNQALDHGVVLYAQGMEQRAKERLILYEYYLAKAYEYRILENYDYKGHDLDYMFDRMKTMLGAENGILSKDDFDTLSNVYNDRMQEMTKKLVSSLNSGKRELQSSNRRIELSEKQLDELNKNEEIVINLMEMGEVPYSMENVRISELGVYTSTKNKVTTHGIKGELVGDVSSVSIEFNHSGRSILRSKKKLYAFDNSGDNSGMFWRATYTPGIDELSNDEPSPASNSFFNTMLDNEKETGKLKYSRHGAWADIRISVEPSPPGRKYKLTELALQYKFDYQKPPQMNRVLYLRLPKRFSPHISFDKADSNGLKDARQSSFKIYQKNDTVSLTAPLNYAGATFVEWKRLYIRSEAEHIPMNPLAMNMTHHCLVTPVYEKDGSLIEVDLTTGVSDFDEKLAG